MGGGGGGGRWRGLGAAVAGAAVVSLAAQRYRRRHEVVTSRGVLVEEEEEEGTGDASPWIVHVVLDDVGMNDMLNSTDLPTSEVTPTLRALADEGVTLSNMYGQDYCTPSRVALLTGMFAHKTGFARTQGDDVGPAEVFTTSNFSIPLGVKLLPEYLQNAGYATHGIGKWNVGHCNEAYVPWKRGFLTFAGYFGDGIGYTTHYADTNRILTFPDGRSANVTDFFEYEGGEVVDWRRGLSYEGRHTIDVFTDMAVDRLSGASGATYLYLSYHAVHDDLQSTSTLAYSKDKWDRLEDEYGLSSNREDFGIVLSAVDEAIGRVKATLDDREVSYLLVVHSDNGGMPCSFRLCGNNLPYRGTKFHFFEGGVKVPAFVYSNDLLPTSRRGGTFDGLAHHVDWLATFLDAAGVDPATVLDEASDSLSFWPGIRDVDAGPNRSEILFSITQDSLALRIGDYKLLYQLDDSRWYSPDYRVASPRQLEKCNDGTLANHLFDLASDPHERTNLYHHRAYREIREGLLAYGRARYAADAISIPSGFAETDDPSLLAAWNATTDRDSDTVVAVPWGCQLIAMRE
ncbi:hypothetical protein CTAYLR_006316 [Chrysophaeum taylorii]|uniref:Sulfatase N-terminal domain-containing protein n=1 Tax=Chrysophaeum taylorii TaxID=2483200 RepID=A0AAD7XIS9_9STRA|nr:hypothetical protein CTAYLR_006316 [Chrysophaeum taylorii]